MTGTVKQEIGILEVVEPYIHVRCPANKGKNDEDAPEAKRKGRGKKAKGKGKAQDTAPTDDTTQSEPYGGINISEAVEKTEKVLVVKKIETTPSRHIVFSAVGCVVFAVTQRS